jgi:hypothetical protein
MWIKATCCSSLIVHAISLPSEKCACNHTKACGNYSASSSPITCKGCLRYLRQWPEIEKEIAALGKTLTNPLVHHYMPV